MTDPIHFSSPLGNFFLLSGIERLDPKKPSFKEDLKDLMTTISSITNQKMFTTSATIHDLKDLQTDLRNLRTLASIGVEKNEPKILEKIKEIKAKFFRITDEPVPEIESHNLFEIHRSSNYKGMGLHGFPEILRDIDSLTPSQIDYEENLKGLIATIHFFVEHNSFPKLTENFKGIENDLKTLKNSSLSENSIGTLTKIKNELIKMMAEEEVPDAEMKVEETMSREEVPDAEMTSEDEEPDSSPLDK